MSEEEEVLFGNKSYLNPRVLSILAQNYPNNEATTNEVSFEEVKEDNFLRVHLRIKKSENFENLYTVKDNTLQCKVPNSKVSKLYKFSNIFGPNATQSQVYIDVIQKKVINFIKGINSTLLTYGASGSGKTYTILGTPTQPGIVPRALEYFFQTLPKLPPIPHIKPTPSGGIIKLTSQEGGQERLIVTSILNQCGDRIQHSKTYSIMQRNLKDNPVAVIDDDISDVHLSVWISFAEIYNESVYDLLSMERKKGHSRKKLRLVYYNNNAYIKDLHYINVTSAAEAYYLLQYGLQSLNYASTSVNDHSSRSHSIFTIKLAQASDSSSGVSVSSFNFCDLAGSERLKKTNNVGDRLKESNNINASLLVLGRCIHAIRDLQRYKNSNLIPFRESKLTQLFQNALLGNEYISMIVCINPNKEMFDETQHVLNFSAIAKDVVVEPQQRIRHHKNKENLKLKSDVIMEEDLGDERGELENYLAFLCSEIEQCRLNHSEEMDQIVSNYKDMIEKTKQAWDTNCKELEKLIQEESRLVFEDSIKLSKVQEQSRKRKNSSVICIDTSSDEENQCTNTTKKKKKGHRESIHELENQVCELKQKKEAEDVDIQNKLAKIKSLKETLKGVKETCEEIRSRWETESQELKAEIIIQEDKLADLTRYVDLDCETQGNCRL